MKPATEDSCLAERPLGVTIKLGQQPGAHARKPASPLTRPGCAVQAGLVPAPEVDAVVMSARHGAHALGFGSKLRVAEHAPNELSRLRGSGVQENQTITRVAEFPPEEIFVAREEGRLLEAVQQDYDVVVISAELGKVPSDQPAMDAPGAQQVALVHRDVLVQNVHAALGRRDPSERGTSRPRSSSQVVRERRSASAMAALVSFPPPHRRMIKSQDKPLSMSSRTSETKMRVPLKVTFPWQTFGSATMCWPNSIRSAGRGVLRFLAFFMGRLYRWLAPTSSRFAPGRIDRPFGWSREPNGRDRHSCAAAGWPPWNHSPSA